MAQPDYSYSEAKARLEEIVAEVRRKDVSLEKSLDLLEEAGRLAAHCTDLIDRADLEANPAGDLATEAAGYSGEAVGPDGAAPADGEAAGEVDDNGEVTDSQTEPAE